LADWRFIFEKWILGKHWSPPFEPKVKQLIRSMKGDVFIDIGSNTGIYSRLAQKRFKQVYSFDPNPEYHAIQFAISDRRGVQPFYYGNGIGSADSLVRNPHILGIDWKNETDSIQVETLTFDDLRLDADLVKIDVEGAEFKVLEGMNLYLPKTLIIELHDERRENELVEKMNGKGYSTSRIDSSHFLFTLPLSLQYHKGQQPEDDAEHVWEKVAGNTDAEP